MEIGSLIRQHRTAKGMSQDDLAARVYVSRQTISSWERGKTYPDVQSLLLLSDIFGTTVDSLIKGDVETMNEAIEKDVAIIRRLGVAMAGLLALSIAAVIWFAVQCTVWGWGLDHALPTFLLALTFWGGAMFASCWAERIKRNHDLVTFGEVLAFWEGKDPDRTTNRGLRERAMPRWMRAVRTVGMILLAAAIGFLCSRYGIPLLEAMLG